MNRVRVVAKTTEGHYVAKLETRLSDKSIYRKEINGDSDYYGKERTALFGAVATMKKLRRPCEVTYETDTPYLAAGHARIENWKKNGWMTTKQQPIKNRDLWEALERACKETGSTVTFFYNNKKEAETASDNDKEDN